MKRWPAAIVIAAVLLRGLAILHFHAWQSPAEENRIIARNLAQGQGYTFADFAHVGPTTIRPPLYPFLLAMLDRLLGVESPAALTAALTVNVLAGGMAAFLIMAVARTAAHERAGLLAGALLAVWPTQVYAAAQFQGLSLAVALMLAALWLCQRKWPIAAGVAIGLTALCESILFLPLLAAGLWYVRKRPDAWVLLPLACFTLTLPWAYRNSIVCARPTLLTGRLGSDLFHGNGPAATGSTQLNSIGSDGKRQTEVDLLSAEQFDSLRRQPEPQRDAIFYSWARQWIDQHPGTYLKLCVVRMLKTIWLDWSHPLAASPVNLLTRSLACCGGLLALVIRPHAALPCAIIAGGLVLCAIFTVAEARNCVLIDVPQLLGVALLLKPRAA